MPRQSRTSKTKDSSQVVGSSRGARAAKGEETHMSFIIDMKRVLCGSTSCPARRRSHEDDTPRGEVWFWVTVDAREPCYCSMECSVYGQKELGPSSQADGYAEEQDIG